MKKLVLLIVVSLFLAGCSSVQPAVPSAAASTAPAASITQAQTSAPVASQTSPAATQSQAGGATTPVLIKGLLVGGISQGKWMQAPDFFNSGAVDFDGYLYDVYVDGKKTGTATGGLPTDSLSGETLTGNEYIPGYDIIELQDKSGGKVAYDIAIRADWNLFPRSFASAKTDDPAYLALAKTLLKNEGLADPKTTVKQVIRADLDSNGSDEILIAADNTAEDRFEQVKAGDNAILIFKPTAAASGQVVEKDIRMQDESEPSIYRWLFRIHTIADLDGDGAMEVVVRSWYYEGESWSVYKLDGNELKPVASNGWGV